MTEAVGQGSNAATAAVPEALARDLEELGLSPYEARVLLALLFMASANSLQLARLSGVPRTSVYQVLEALAAKQLAQRLPGKGPATWTTPGRDEVLDRLHAIQEEDLRRHRLRTDQVRHALAEAFPEREGAELPYVHLLHGTAQVARTYDRLWDEARSEVLAFSRPPYSSPPGKVVRGVTDALGRSVAVRALYQQAEVGDPESASFRQEVRAYMSAGVEARIVPELPVKLLVFDRQVTLVALTPPVVQVGYPTNMVIEHAGFAEVQADAFETRWHAAEPFSAFEAANR